MLLSSSIFSLLSAAFIMRASSWLAEPAEWADAAYIELGARHGVPMFASSSCLPVQEGGWSCRVNPAGVNPVVLAQRTLRSMEAGAQGISLYQSDTGVQWDGLKEALPALSDEDELHTLLADDELIRAWPITDENREFGIDNHSRMKASGRFQADVGAHPLGV